MMSIGIKRTRRGTKRRIKGKKRKGREGKGYKTSGAYRLISWPNMEFFFVFVNP